MKRWKDRLRLGLFVLSCVVIAVALVLPGCNSEQLPFARSRARRKAAQLADKKVELQELAAEWEKLQAEAEADPVPVKIEKADNAKVLVTAKVSDVRKTIRDLAELTAAITDSEQTVKQVSDQAEGVAAYLPSPWREAAVLVLGIGGTLIQGRGRAKVLKRAGVQRAHDLAIEVSNQTRAEDEAVIAGIVASVEKVLTPELKEKIRQGPATEAAVKKAKGRV